MTEPVNTTEVIICDNCGSVISQDYIDKSPRLRTAAIKLCEECVKQRSKIYARLWHQKHLKEHREVNRLYQQKYRKEGKNKASIEKFWSNPEHKSKRAQYIKNYMDKKIKELGVTRRELNKLFTARLVKGATKDNVHERLKSLENK